MNNELISRTLKRIETGHKHFNMEWFHGRITKKTQKVYKHLDCGTVCCFAGELVLESLGATALKRATDVASIAGVVAGLTQEDQNALFYTGHISMFSPDICQFEPGTRKYAKFVTGKIREYIKKKYNVAV